MSGVTVEVAAPAALVFGLARDPVRWEVLLPHYLRSRLVRRELDGRVIASFVALRPIIPWLGLGLPVAWRSRSWNDPTTHRLDFQHLGGATDRLHATWHIVPTSSGCHVTIDHHWPPGRRIFGRVVDRLFTRPIARRTLATFKALAEALVADLPAIEDAAMGRRARTKSRRPSSTKNQA